MVVLLKPCVLTLESEPLAESSFPVSVDGKDGDILSHTCVPEVEVQEQDIQKNTSL
jgi:hypothetical protein